MTQDIAKLDANDRSIIAELQADASLSQRALAERVGISQNACWRRLQRLESEGVLGTPRASIDYSRLGFDLTAMVFIKTPHHSGDWARRFRDHVGKLPGVIDLYRIGGEWDYMIRVVTRGIAGYDEFYRRLVEGFELSVVNGHFVMERVIEDQPLDLR